jgi:hypothetical protein
MTTPLPRISGWGDQVGHQGVTAVASFQAVWLSPGFPEVPLKQFP